jgi:hypothetical protein
VQILVVALRRPVRIAAAAERSARVRTISSRIAPVSKLIVRDHSLRRIFGHGSPGRYACPNVQPMPSPSSGPT